VVVSFPFILDSRILWLRGSNYLAGEKTILENQSVRPISSFLLFCCLSQLLSRVLYNSHCAYRLMAYVPNNTCTLTVNSDSVSHPNKLFSQRVYLHLSGWLGLWEFLMVSRYVMTISYGIMTSRYTALYPYLILHSWLTISYIVREQNKVSHKPITLLTVLLQCCFHLLFPVLSSV